MLDEIEHISLQPQQNLPPSSKRKLRRPGREQLIRLKTYGNRIPPGREQPANKTRVLHRLAVDGLDLVLDQVPPNPVYASDGKSAYILRPLVLGQNSQPQIQLHNQPI